VNERRVLHFGPDHREPGGMAHVIGSYLDARLEPWRVAAVASYSSRSRLWWLWRLVTSLGVVTFARRRRIAGVHVHASERFDIVRSLLLLEVARRRRLPRILTIHGGAFVNEAEGRPRLVRAMLRRADVVTTLTPEFESVAHSLGSERVVVLPNPVEVRSVSTGRASRAQVLFAGEIRRRKGVDILIEAWPAVRAACPDVALLLLGRLVEPDLVASLPEGATYGGLVGREGVGAALDDACLAVLPSRSEAMPMFLLEAMGAGVPVIGTPVGSVEALVGGGGVVVPVGDARALAEAMIALLSDPARLAELGLEAQRRVLAEFSVEAFERHVVELYESTFTG
jgi:glycosyltransferase involved in cell wall biosynthesis